MNACMCVCVCKLFYMLECLQNVRMYVRVCVHMEVRTCQWIAKQMYVCMYVCM